MREADRREHRLIEHVDALRSGMFPPRHRSVLEAERDVRAAFPYSRYHLVGAPLHDTHLELRLLVQMCNRGGDERCERAGECCETELALCIFRALVQLG